VSKNINTKDLKYFALIWAMIFFVSAFFPLVRHAAIRQERLILSIIFIIISFACPSILTGFYKIWIKIGDLIGGIVSKLIIVIMFYAIFTPVSFVLKLLNKDLLNKKIDKNIDTYWINRKIQPGSLKNQF